MMPSSSVPVLSGSIWATFSKRKVVFTQIVVHLVVEVSEALLAGLDVVDDGLN